MSQTIMQQCGKSTTSTTTSSFINNRHQPSMVWKSTHQSGALPPFIGHKGSPPLKSCLKKVPDDGQGVDAVAAGVEEILVGFDNKKTIKSSHVNSKSSKRRRRGSSRKVDNDRNDHWVASVSPSTSILPPPPSVHSGSPSRSPRLHKDRASSGSSASSRSYGSSDLEGSAESSQNDRASKKSLSDYDELDSSQHHPQQNQQQNQQNRQPSRGRSGGSGGSTQSAAESHPLSPGSMHSSSSHVSSASAPVASVPKSVRFSEVQVRDYERVVGDNPSCSSGVPISIGWKYGKTRVVNLDLYEDARQHRRSQIQMVLPRSDREKLLLSWGASCNDIIEAIRINIRAKNKRRQTVTNLGKVERLEEAFESATRKLKRTLLLRRRTADKVREMQERAHVAAQTLATLKIAEDRALTEIAADRRIRQEQEPDHDDELRHLDVQVAGSDLCRANSSDPVADGGSLSDRVVEDDAISSVDGLTIGNSTTASVLEMERFYRELEQEMFGDLDIPPSMVGQTLEVPVALDVENDPDDTRNEEDFSESAPADDELLSGGRSSLRNMSSSKRPVIYCEPRLPSSSHTGDMSLLSQSMDMCEQLHPLDKDHPLQRRSIELDDPELLGPLKEHFNRLSSSSHSHIHGQRRYPIPQYDCDRPELDADSREFTRLGSSLDSAYMGYRSNIHADSRFPPASLHRSSQGDFGIGGSDERSFQRHHYDPELRPPHVPPRYVMDDRQIDYSSLPLMRPDDSVGDRRQHYVPIHHVPPPIYFTPTHWMENRDASSIPEHSHDAVIISEGPYTASRISRLNNAHHVHDHSRPLPSSFF